MHWVVIPFRGPETAKSRLGQGLSEAARRHVAGAMFQHVLNVSVAAAGAARVLVVTPSTTAARTARRMGAAVLRETVSGHNEAVTEACRHLRARGASTATIVAADLPLLAQSNVEALMRWARAGLVALAPDRSGEGTNAIALPLTLAFQFHFGEDSYAFHLMRYRRGNVRVRTVRHAALAADVDVPADLALLTDPAALSTLPTVSAAAYRRLA